MIHLAALCCCDCSSAEIAAVAPGTEPEGVDLFTPLAANADRGQQARAWCWGCWSARYASAPEAAPG